jgi:NAD(P)-dependent dehydrogenase (short-subunit alcohol dehydrogenase family)
MIEQAKLGGAPGHVVNVSSAFGYYGGSRTIGYCTSKFAVFGLSESLRNELAPHGIGVSVICPGVIDTDIISTTRISAEPGRSPDRMRERVQKMYKKRNYPPEGVAEAIVEAVRCRRAVVPVTAEAWLLWFTSRVSAKLSHRFGNLANRRID